VKAVLHAVALICLLTACLVMAWIILGVIALSMGIFL